MKKKTKHLEQFDCSDVENAAVFKSDVGKKNENEKWFEQEVQN